MSKNRTPIALAIGAAVATGALAAGSLFTMDAMAHGYMQDSGKAKPAASEGKCGEGKCGAGMMADKAATPHDSQSDMSHGKHAHAFADIDTDKDGRISRTEFAAAHAGKDTMFPKVDGNGDGFISKEEFDAHHAAMGKAMSEGKCGEGTCGGNM
ncbi:EF-hand domain-containing protein [Thermomonas sp.]|uniref:HvfA family oxazolone/thioamide-modified RiPP metallophore n=1 Tax=Thermomonas sp. TaxID=1971895 RepID=UPI0035AE0E32